MNLRLADATSLLSFSYFFCTFLVLHIPQSAVRTQTACHGYSLLGAPEHPLGAGGEIVLVLDGEGCVCRENGQDCIRQAWVYGVSSFTTWDLLLYLLAFFLGRVLRGLG